MTSIAEKQLLTARTLSEALPYMRRFSGETFVVKYGGHAMGDDQAAHDFARDIVLLKQVGINPVVVHGGGPQIGDMLKRLAIKSEFVDGLRVTDKATAEVAEMVLSGTVNKQIVAAINAQGGLAVGISGKDANLIQARKLTRRRKNPKTHAEEDVELGFVGEPVKVNTKVLDDLTDSALIPVISPIGVGLDGHTYNLNADTAAGAVAGAVSAAKLIMLTDVAGVLDRDKKVISRLTAQHARSLIADGTISGGMIPKVETCLLAIDAGARTATILDGRVRHALLLEIFTEHGIGTMIERED
ncbi:MAG: acetylglutamate kinase [Alphaproteobacteria bacterium]|nr:acetylglutamate kinase [Alphaproteobacteria bacterium]